MQTGGPYNTGGLRRPENQGYGQPGPDTQRIRRFNKFALNMGLLAAGSGVPGGFLLVDSVQNPPLLSNLITNFDPDIERFVGYGGVALGTGFALIAITALFNRPQRPTLYQ